MTSIFFVAISHTVDATAHSMDTLYERLGKNTGNLMFTNAVRRQVAWTTAESGFTFDPGRINSTFDAVVIPAANWLYEGVDFAELADLVGQLRIPTVLIGIGAQAGPDRAVPILKEGTLRFIRNVSERSVLIGTRGAFSSRVLDFYGIRNHIPIGCPSLFLNGRTAHIRKRSLNRMILSGTRYGPPRVAGPADALQRALYVFAATNGIDINYQSERPELDFISAVERNDGGPALSMALAEYYGLEGPAELSAFLGAHGKYYFDIDHWIEDMGRYDLYVGSRIHGAIASLLAGTPALVLAHDARTAELADFVGIPRVDIAEAALIGPSWVEDVYGRLEFSTYERLRAEMFDRYVAFLGANGLVSWTTVPSDHGVETMHGRAADAS